MQKRFFNVPVTMTTSHEFVGHAPTSKGKGKGDYLTSVAKQAKTAFLHGPTV